MLATLPPGLRRGIAGARGRATAGAFSLIAPYFRINRALRRRRLRALERSRRPVVVFLAPEAGLTPFFASHAILARTLEERGQPAVFLSCDGLMPACTVKFSLSMQPTAAGNRQNPACRLCRRNALRVAKRYDLVDESIESLVDAADRSVIDTLIARYADAPQDLVYDGIALGAVAVGDALRNSRRSDIAEFTPTEIALTRALLYSTLLVHFALRKLEARYNVGRIVFFGDYTYWIAAQAYAETRGIAVTHLDHGYNMDVDRRLIDFRPGSINAHTLEQVELWPRYRDVPISPDMVAEIGEASLFRLRGHGGVSTYSPNWVRRDRPLQEELGFRCDRKTIVAYSSSLDEFVAVDRIMQALGKPYGQQPRPFFDQHAWLQALVEWVGSRSDLQLIVRLHPRLAAGRRHDAHASEYYRFKREFAVCPSNVLIAWPEDPMSSYNLAEVADVAAVAWSTIGLELARFGIPVVAAFPDLGPYPVGSFIDFAAEPGEHFGTIEKAMSEPAALDRITEAFRWTHYVHRSPTIDVSDLIPTPNYAEVPAWHLPKNHALIYGSLARGQDVSMATMAGLDRGAAAFAEERQAMLRVVDRFVDFFMAREGRPLSGERRLRPQSDRSISYEVGGEIVNYYSPLAHRLLALADAKVMSALAPSV